MINTLYQYKLKEEIEAEDIAHEATKEFHEQKHMFMSNNRQCKFKRRHKAKW